jgi:hypothetical protein
LRAFIILFFLFIFFETANAQENHYWTQQVGSIPSMIGGAATANSNDNSAIYYNPGSLAFVKSSSLTLVGGAYFLSSLNISNGGGTGIALKSRIVDTTPQIISGTIKNKKNPDFSVTYAIINQSFSFFNVKVNHEMFYDILPNLQGEEIYIGNYDYYNRQREDWAGIGMGHKLGKYFGVGFSYFFTFRSQDLTRSYSANVVEYLEQIDISSSLANSSFREDFEFRNLGMLWKIGLSFEKEDLKLGLNITTPRVNLGVISGSLRRDLITRIPPLTNVSPIQSTNQKEVQTVHKLPLQIDLGAEYIIDKTSLSLRLGYSGKISPYSLLKAQPPANEIQDILRPEDENFNTMLDASKALINFGFGFVNVFKEGWAILGGYSTDFNYFDDQELNRQDYYVPSISYWDVHHLSGGFTHYGEKYYISLGLNYSLGRSGGIQEINLTEPTLENDLFGERNDTAYAKYNHMNLNVGFTYLFVKK